ncbi:MAG TPA: MBL fold metallo-hydrolase [Jatrophihabitans sp.]|nr:MBL fold metallo-hydrolase [Jatrophihabitans sp.]
MTAESASVQFIGTATTLIRYADLCLLTDPNFLHRGERAYLGYGLTAKRLTEPALEVAELPPLDGIVLSHLHGDHWDRRAQRGLSRNLPVLTTPHAARRLKLRGFRRASGLPTWHSYRLAGKRAAVRITSLPGRHAPGALRHLLPPVMGSCLEFGDPDGGVRLRMYLTGDTLLIPQLAEIPRRMGELDAAVLHLGGTRLPGGLLVTMTGEQGVDLVQLVRPRAAIGVHYDDYRLFTSPLTEFTDELARRGLGDRLRPVGRGETVDLTDLVDTATGR